MDRRAGACTALDPCLAGMEIAVAYDEILLHVSGHITKDHVAEQVKPFARAVYLDPRRRSDQEPDPGS